MGRRDLQERLDRLEHQIPQPSDQKERKRWTEHFVEHFKAWCVDRRIEDIRGESRDAQMWAYAEKYGPVYLGLVWQGSIEGREELLAEGVDFSLAE